MPQAIYNFTFIILITYLAWSLQGIWDELKKMNKRLEEVEWKTQ